MKVKSVVLLSLMIGALSVVCNAQVENQKVTDVKINDEQQVYEENETEPVSFAYVDDKPEFPGGDMGLMKYLAENTKYPEIAKENGISGRVFVQFVIDKTGAVTRVKVLRGVDPVLDAEAIRVVTAMPRWKPGMQRGKAVPVTYQVPINFKAN